MNQNNRTSIIGIQAVAPRILLVPRGAHAKTQAKSTHGCNIVSHFVLDQTIIGISYSYLRIRLIGGYRQTVSLKDASHVIGPEQPRSSLSRPAGRGGDARRKQTNGDKKTRLLGWKTDGEKMYRLKSERGGSGDGVLNALAPAVSRPRFHLLFHIFVPFFLSFFFSSLFLFCYASNNAQCTRCYAAIVYVILFARRRRRRLLHPQPRNTRRVRHVIFVPKTCDVYNTTMYIFNNIFFSSRRPSVVPANNNSTKYTAACAQSGYCARENRGRHASKCCAFCWQADNAQDAQQHDDRSR